MKRRTFTPEEVDVALTALVLLGSSIRAAQHLRAEGVPVTASTLRKWRATHAARLAQLQTDLAPEVADRVASRSEAVALRAIDLEEELIVQAGKGVGDLKPAEAAAAFRNVATGKALQFDRISNPVRGRPNIIHGSQASLDELVERLQRSLGLPFAVDSTAVELEPGTPD